MRLLLPVLLATLPLTACTGLLEPRTAAQATLADEKAKNGAELAYQTATKLGRLLAQNNIIDKEKFKSLDNRAYSALLAVRDAYRAGNSTTLALAVAELERAVLQINDLAK